MRKTCLNRLKLCLKESTATVGVSLARAAIGFFNFLVPKGGWGFRTHVFVKTNLDSAKDLVESDCIKKKSNLKTVLKKLLFLLGCGCLSALIT